MKLPKGFLLSKISAGIKADGSDDMALIVSEVEAVAAATFTTNKVKCAHVRIGMRKIRSSRARAVLVTSGNANSCTGQPGMDDATELTNYLADMLQVPERRVFICSTGIIGVRLPVDKMKDGIGEMGGMLGQVSLEEAARAIMTTDSYPKFLSTKIKIGSRTGTLCGIAKGAGMIAPNMATMLCFLMTDLAIEPGALRAALRDSVERSFNRITIDGDRSTNDTAMVLANGYLGNVPIAEGSREYKRFKLALGEMTYGLSALIARDGEGATKFVEVSVKGARTESDAKRAAFKVANSKLVKTALYGADPNWGRIMVALGASGAKMDEAKTDIFIGNVQLVKRGVSAGGEARARRVMGRKNIKITLHLNMGRAEASVLTCDLTEEFVRFNSAYTS